METTSSSEAVSVVSVEKIDSPVRAQKRKPFDKLRRSQPSKRFKSNIKTFANGQQKNEKKIIDTTSQYVPVLVKLQGLFALTEAVYSALTSRDSKLLSECSLFLFQYISYSLAFIKLLKLDTARCIYIDGMATLNDLYSTIELPGPVADFIDALGFWKTPNGISIVPTLGNIYSRQGYQLPQTQGAYTNPFPFMLVIPEFWIDWTDTELQCSKPSDSERMYGTHELYGVNHALFARYLAICSRLKKYGNMRTLSSSLDGTPVIAISCEKAHDNGFVPKSPCIIEDHYARKGVAFGFHDACELESWPNANKSVLWPVCSGSVINRDIVLAELASGSIRSPTS